MNEHQAIRRRLRAAAGGMLAAGFIAAALSSPAGAAPAAAEAEASSTPVGRAVEAGDYLVRLADDAVAAYDGGVAGLGSTRPADGARLDLRQDGVKRYQDHLLSAQRGLRRAVKLGEDRVYDEYTVVENGFAARLTAEQVRALASDPRVEAVEPAEMLELQGSTTEFLGLGADADGTGGVWDALGGTEAAGEGIVVGIVDSGIAPENPSFAGEPLGTEATGGRPYRQGGLIHFDKADGQRFTGECEEGQQFTADLCNTKLIGARSFLFGTQPIATPAQGEYDSPRDGNGHGSHTASTAAGNFGVEAVVGPGHRQRISGVAPAARIASYKACWSYADGTAGCNSLGLVSAIEQAVKDGVDVINYSIGPSGGASTSVGSSDLAFLNAVNAGVFVAASAGNSGPGASTVGNTSPWITTVANSTYANPQSDLVLGDGRTFTGHSLTVPSDGLPQTALVRGQDASLDGNARAALCDAGSLDPSKAAGTVVVCDRGEIALVDKAAEVARAGGAGMVLVNVPGGAADLAALDYVVPAVHVGAEAGATVKEYAAGGTGTAAFAKEPSDPVDIPVPQIAGSSSRGPIRSDAQNLLKPDVAAPGTTVIAAGANPAGGEPRHVVMSGTSMASPHVAGLAALYLGERPLAGADEIRSALMGTAVDLKTPDGGASRDVFAQGAGHVGAGRFLDAGFYHPAPAEQWTGYRRWVADPSHPEAVSGTELNIPSIAAGEVVGARRVTRTVTSLRAGTWTADVDVPGFTATVEPARLEFTGPGQSLEYTVSFTRTTAPLDRFAQGHLLWKGPGADSIRVPVALRPVGLQVPAAVAGTGTTGGLCLAVVPGETGPVVPSSTALQEAKYFRATEGWIHSGTSLYSMGPGRTGAAPARASEFSGRVEAAKETIGYEFEVPEGTERLVLELTDAHGANTDLDMVLFRKGSSESLYAQTWTGAASVSRNERLVVEAPVAGGYRINAQAWQFAAGQSSAEWHLTVMAEGSDGAAAELVLPASVDGTAGVPLEIPVRWSGLKADSHYQAVIRYDGLQETTAVSITTGAAVEDPVALPCDAGAGEPDPGTPGPGVPDDDEATRPGTPVLQSDNGWDTGLMDGDYSITMNLWWGGNGSLFRLYEDGELVAVHRLEAASPNAQSVATRITGRPNGSYVYTGELVNSAGSTWSAPVTVRVSDAAPGRPVLSTEGPATTGGTTVVANLWWGTNATGYRLLEDGEVVDEQVLEARTPQAQSARTTLKGLEPGRHRYVAEFFNDAGSTASNELVVTVRP
ncbi:S8 family serine peptidase [Zafaria sp. J156]|uniref:S8 family serine peptidase n=1 Tax=Zafaria sp. J156 TaxID=3116490 RepID=UPI002E77BAA4|nr:S8 family serine peptidase [Zafaria sp. J156]MEE1622489.1 S8 family serine peptidase [Zafaria sp. J156]